MSHDEQQAAQLPAHAIDEGRAQLGQRLQAPAGVFWVVGIIAALIVVESPLGDSYNRFGINLILAPAGLLLALLNIFVPWQRLHRGAYAIVLVASIAIMPPLVAWSGGWSSPFPAYYPVIVAFVALTHPRRIALLVACGVTVLRLSPLLFGLVPPGGFRYFLQLLLTYSTIDVTIAIGANAMGGEMARLYATALERLKERERMERALALSEQRYRSLFAHHPDAVFALDGATNIQSANPAVAAVMGYSEADLRGTPLTALVVPAAQESATDAIHETLAGAAQQREIALRHKFGGQIDMQLMTLPIVVEGQVAGLFGIAKDITVQKAHEADLAHQAHYDPLTELPNRALFLERLAIARTRARASLRPFAVLYLDLDGFKEINDLHGHQSGDQVLVTVATRLASTVRPPDMVARLGGDEFTILIEDLEGQAAAEAIATRLLESLRPPIPLRAIEVAIGASVGIVLADGTEDLPYLLHRADLAMYRAKQDDQPRSARFASSPDTLEGSREIVYLPARPVRARYPRAAQASD